MNQCCKDMHNTKVLSTRPSVRPDKQFIKRRRKCLVCGDRTTTYEISSENLEKLIDDIALQANAIVLKSLTKFVHRRIVNHIKVILE